MSKSSIARAALAAAIAVAASGTAAVAGPSFSVIYKFTGGNDGFGPAGDLVLDGRGNLYGTTDQGGGFHCALPTAGCGTVFQLHPPTAAGGAWTETVLYRFRGGADGEDPTAGVVFGPSGALYGTTDGGLQGTDLGGVFQLQPHTGALTPLTRFGHPDKSGGFYPQAIPAFDRTGALYGTTLAGGAQSLGVVFKLTPAPGPGPWPETVLYSFCKAADCTDGSLPSGRLTFGSSGLYGTTTGGGAHNAGAVFRLRPTGQLDTLHNFCDEPNCTDGAEPQGVIVDRSGAVYGTTFTCVGQRCRGTVFKVTLAQGTAHYTALHRFCTLANTCPDGEFPDGGLAMDGAGALYGTTTLGGAFGHGVVFKLSSHGYDVLHSFSDAGGRTQRQPSTRTTA